MGRLLLKIAIGPAAAGALLILLMSGLSPHDLGGSSGSSSAAGPCAFLGDDCSATAWHVDTQESATPANTAGTGDNGLSARSRSVRVLTRTTSSTRTRTPSTHLNVDVVIDDVPPYSNAGTPADPTDDYGGIISHTFDFGYDETNLTIQSHTIGLVAARPGSRVTDVSDPTPDTDNSDNFASANLDTSTTIPESGDGFLERFVISSDAAAVAGNYPLTVSNNAHLDVSGAAQIPPVTNGGSISINEACPPPPTPSHPSPDPTPSPTPSPTPTPPGHLTFADAPGHTFADAAGHSFADDPPVTPSPTPPVTPSPTPPLLRRSRPRLLRSPSPGAPNDVGISKSDNLTPNVSANMTTQFPSR